MDENSIIDLNGKTVELIVSESTTVSLISGSSGGNSGNVNVSGKKEDEKITSAVMKVLQGYQWSLVPAATK